VLFLFYLIPFLNIQFDKYCMYINTSSMAYLTTKKIQRHIFLGLPKKWRSVDYMFKTNTVKLE